MDFCVQSPKYFDEYSVEDYRKLAFVFGTITELYYYAHDLFGERLQMFGKGYDGAPITLSLDYEWLLELGWIPKA